MRRGSRQYRKLRRFYKANNPLCEDCLENNLTVPVQEVHHIVPVAIAPHRLMDWDNLRSLCKDCHKKKHHSK